MLGIAVILAFVIGLRILIGKILGLGSKQKTTYRHENPQPEQEQKKPSNGRPADGKRFFQPKRVNILTTRKSNNPLFLQKRGFRHFCPNPFFFLLSPS